MKKVTAFVGAARKKFTYDAVSQFLDSLKARGDIETEIVRLSDYRLGTCRGCKVCFMKGEEFCPLKDDRDVLIGKMMASDGVVLATPNYSFHVSGLMKVFLDRLGFVFHRPCFFGKAFTSVIAQGFYGGNKIERYLDFVGKGLGFNTVKGIVFTALEPMTEKERRKQDRALADLGRRFSERLMKPAFPAPSFFWLMAFRGARASVQWELDETARDHIYYKDKGWFTSDYFYPVRLSPLKKLAGSLLDARAARKGKKEGRARKKKGSVDGALA